MLRLARAGLEKLSLFFYRRMDTAEYEQYTNILSPAPTEQTLGEALDGIFAVKNKASDENIRQLLGLCGKNIIALTLIQMTALSFVEPGVRSLFARISPEIPMK